MNINNFYNKAKLFLNPLEITYTISNLYFLKQKQAMDRSTSLNTEDYLMRETLE